MGAKLYTIDKISEQQHHTTCTGAREARDQRRARARDPARDVPGGSPPRAPVHPVGQSGREVARARAAGCGLRALTVIHTNNRDALIRAEC